MSAVSSKVFLDPDGTALVVLEETGTKTLTLLMAADGECSLGFELSREDASVLGAWLASWAKEGKS